MWKLLAACILVSVVGAADRRNIVEYLSSKSQFSTLVKTAGLVDTLTNIHLLKYHVVAERIYSSNLSDGQVVKTLNGKNFSVSVRNNVVKINGAIVITADINTNNGVIHAVDGVLLPPSD